VLFARALDLERREETWIPSRDTDLLRDSLITYAQRDFARIFASARQKPAGDCMISCAVARTSRPFRVFKQSLGVAVFPKGFLMQKSVFRSRFLGAILLLLSLGLLALLVSITLLGTLGTLYMEAMSTDFWSRPRVQRRILYVTFLFVITATGVGMLENKKIVVLYLRRFGRSANVVDPNYRGGLGSGIRLVTLEDKFFQPCGVTKKELIVAIFAPLLCTTLLIVLSAWIARIFLGRLDEDNESTYINLAYFLGFWTWMFAFLTISFSIHQLYLKKTSILSVSDIGSIEKTLSAVAWMSSKLFKLSVSTRRSTVVRVTDEIWQETVKSLTKVTHLVLIDISDPSSNIKWERNMLIQSGIPHILISEASYTPEHEVNADVMFYDSRDFDSLKKFRLLLRLEILKRAIPDLPLLGLTPHHQLGRILLLDATLAITSLFLALVVSMLLLPIYLSISGLG
jgi:hypothetical protein